MMIAIEQVHLLFFAHPEGVHGTTYVQLVRQGVKKLQACGPLYGRVLSIWNTKYATFRRILLNFRTTIDEEYVNMLARNGRTTLSQDGYEAYHAVDNEDTTALTKSLTRYAEQLPRADARVGKLEARFEAMAMNTQPLGLGLPPQVVEYVHKDMSPPLGFYK